jgi:hypothetical protein
MVAEIEDKVFGATCRLAGLLAGWVHLTGTFGTLVGGDPWVPMSLIAVPREGTASNSSTAFSSVLGTVCRHLLCSLLNDVVGGVAWPVAQNRLPRGAITVVLLLFGSMKALSPGGNDPSKAPPCSPVGSRRPATASLDTFFVCLSSSRRLSLTSGVSRPGSRVPDGRGGYHHARPSYLHKGAVLRGQRLAAVERREELKREKRKREMREEV